MRTLPTLTFDIPADDVREFAGLPQKTRDRIYWLLTCMRAVAGSLRKVAACEEIAGRAKVHRNTIYGAWRRYSESGDWRQLLDRRHTPEFWQRDRDTQLELPADFVSEWKLRVENNERAAKPAWRILIADWKAWRAGDLTKRIPGYDRCPEPSRTTGLPFGWTYSNLRNYLPTDVELAAARKGRTTAKKLLPGIRTTRVGSYPFREIQFDDMWHDFEVNVPGQQESCRLLEFGAVETFSTFLFKPGLKPRLRNMDTGRMQQLGERDFHLYLVNWLLDYGWHPEGTLFNVENGTASISKALEEKLLVWSRGLLTVKRAGMSGRAALPGGWAERAKGNPNAKALKEGLGKLIHNQLASLPGQIGMNRDNLPASYTGRAKENELLLAIAAQVPALAGKLQLGFLDLHEAVYAVNQTYDLLNCRTDHQIEGWDEAGLVVDRFRFSSQSDDWRDMAEVERLPENDRLALAMVLKLDPSLRRRVRLSPAECLLAHKTRLIRLPDEAVPDLLGPEYGEVKEVKGGVIAIKRAELGSAPIRFTAAYQDAAGFRRRLDNGTEVLTHLNPWKPEWAYLSEARTGRYLGKAARDLTPTRGDIDAIHAAHGRAEADYKDAVAEVARRHGLSRIPHLRANALALREAAKPTARERALGGSDFDAADLIAAPAAEAPAEAEAFEPSAAFDPADLL